MTAFGFLNCNKPVGMTSRDLVNIVAKRFRETRDSNEPKIKLGHAGTLDPLAEGVMVLGVGRAVRLVPYVQEQRKHYRSTFLLGQTSVSGDLEGEVISRPDLPVPSLAQLESAARDLTGRISQIPPAHSAIRVDGRRAYQRIRAGEEVKMPSRDVDVYRFEVTRYEFPEVDLDIVCGSGTYIRTLGMDLAKAVGSVGVMKYLRRYRIGVFSEEDALSVEEIRQCDPRTKLKLAVEGAATLPKLTVNDGDAVRLLHGLEIVGELPSNQHYDSDTRAGDSRPASLDTVMDETEVAAIWQNELLAIVKRREGAWWPFRVFPRSDQWPSKEQRPHLDAKDDDR
ncbi:tRNA pseudouridine(55) synthase TruB [Rubripirellula amarantea]|nr:tRNA pseudouridine(55) synthase TruB [Rubripirellula amarantea]